MITREKYLASIRGFYESDLVKVITGVRRCGKSVILETIMSEIKQKTDNIIYLNFERIADFTKAGSVEELLNYVKTNRKNGICYCFFDEIQEIENWQKAVKDLRLDNCSVFITGSNSKLLSNEFLTLLSGRFVSFRIRPFVFKEIREYTEKHNTRIDISNYLIWGGFPGRFNFSSLKDTKTYLNDLEKTIVVNDLINRYKIKKDVIFKKLVNYVLVSNSRIFSIRSIHKHMKIDFPDLAMSTVVNFLKYLKEAYIIEEIPKYSTKTKRELRFYGKIYNCDVALNSIKTDDSRYDLDHNLENIVYNELIYMGYSVKTFDNQGKEIDFIASKEGKSFYVQVAYSVVDEKAYTREMGAFYTLDNRFQKILITNDDFDFSSSTVRHIKLKDFLMLNEL